MNIVNMDSEYILSTTKSYWCHTCKKEFSKLYIKNVEVQCRFCGGNFCEEIVNSNDNTDHPSHFQPYEAANSNNTNSRRASLLNMLHTPRAHRPRTTSSFLDMLIGILGNYHQEESSMESIINYIMSNDPNRYGNPPASKKSVEALEKMEVNESFLKFFTNKNENSCSVCKDEFECKQQLVNLPCKHFFHDECILPWLKERNTCPTCRHELPTDDADFETRKSAI